jgi:hypothetical protein
VCEYILLLAGFCQSLALGDAENAGNRLTELKSWVFAHEPQLVHVFDGTVMVSVFNGLYHRLSPE